MVRTFDGISGVFSDSSQGCDQSDKSKSGAALLHKLANLATTDVEGLDTLLANGPSKMRFAWWTR
jgi:hypothetical protein